MVLGIKNRTENWKTARCLWPFFGTLSVRLARELGEPRATPAADVKLEFYWKGVRDGTTGRVISSHLPNTLNVRFCTETIPEARNH